MAEQQGFGMNVEEEEQMAGQEVIGMNGKEDEEQIVTVSEEQLSKHGFVCIGDSYDMWKIAEYIFGNKDTPFAWHLLDIHNQYCDICKGKMIQMPDNEVVPKEAETVLEHTDKAPGTEAAYTEMTDVQIEQPSMPPGLHTSPTQEDSVLDDEAKSGLNNDCSKQEKMEPDEPSGTDLNEDKNNFDTTVQVSGSPHTHSMTRRSVRLNCKRTTKSKRQFKLPCEGNLLIDEPLMKLKLKPLMKKRTLKRNPGHGTKKFHICEHCGKAFTNTSNLNTHRRTHTGEKPYKCETCGRNFARGDELKNHLRTHTGERPYGCEFCEKTFAKKGGLADHTRIHTGVKPHICHYCNKAFTQSQVLKAHIDLKHSGERKYQCELCGKAFAIKHGLKRHSYTHMAETRYDCEICGKSYNRRDNLTLHNKTKHGSKEAENAE